MCNKQARPSSIIHFETQKFPQMILDSNQTDERSLSLT
jgi:hypothetical protein